MESTRSPATNTTQPGLGPVLVLAAEFPPLGGGGVLRVTKLVKYLARLGWRIEVIASDEPLANAVDETLLNEIPPSVVVRRLRPPLHGVARGVTSTAKGTLGRTSRLFRLLFAIRQAVRSALAIPDRWLPWALTVARSRSLPSAKVILGSGPPHSVHLASALLARRWQVPFVVDLRDEWTLRPLTRSRVPWRIALEARLEAWVLDRAAGVVVVSEESRQRYARRYPRIASRIHVIPNGYDPEDVEGLQSEAAATPVPGAALTVGYAGSFQVGTDIRPFISAIARVVTEGTERHPVRFEMIGPFLPEEVQLVRRSIATDRLTVRGFLPHREALQRMAAWDVLCVVANDGEASLAGKLYECLALRRPIAVIAPSGAATRLVLGLRAGTAASPSDATSITAALHDALRMRDGFAGIGDADLANFSRQEQAHQWSDLLDDLAQTGSALKRPGGGRHAAGGSSDRVR